MTQSVAETVGRDIQNEIESIYESLLRYPWTSRRAYGNWLAQTYFYVRQVSRLLAAAAARTPLDRQDLHEHFLRGIAEEKDHGVLAINDLRALGLGIEQFSESPSTKAFYQTLFHAIEHSGPVSTLGYFFVLEGVAGERGQVIYQMLLNAYGKNAASFMEEHAILDAEHFPRSLALLKLLDEAQLEIVRQGALLAGPLYRLLIADAGSVAQ